MKITNEIKAKVFAQYLGQHIKIQEVPSNDENVVGELKGLYEDQVMDETADDSGEGHYYIGECTLILKPLSEITDEDAVKVAKIIHGDFQIYDVFRKDDYLCVRFGDKDVIATVSIYFNGSRFAYLLNGSMGPKLDQLSLSAYQFLISSGYDLPHYLLGGKTLKEAGLAVYES